MEGLCFKWIQFLYISEIILLNYDIAFDFQLPLALYSLTTLFSALLAMCTHTYVCMYVLLCLLHAR